MADMFFFGPANRRLFGAFFDARTYAQREHGIVFCYPYGDEYTRSHRACRHLARQLTEAGFPTLRFDYSGTGDSSGCDEDASLEAWREDIGHAIDELRGRTGVELICLAGLRLGASLVYQSASTRRDVTTLILWEPIVNGSAYMTELAQQHQELYWRFFDDIDSSKAGPELEFLGHAMNPALSDEITKLDLLTPGDVRGRNVLIIESQPSSDVDRLRAQLANSTDGVTFQRIPSFAAWRDDIDKGLVPNDVLTEIVTWTSKQVS
jgi:alpha/beta superfamily hydrolase